MMTRYLSGLCVAGLGLCGGSWLVVAAVALGGQSAGGGYAHRVNLVTGAGLILVSTVTLLSWALAWRRRLRADGVLAAAFHPVSRRAARRNRRRLAREVRHAAWIAKRADRQARRRGVPAVRVPPAAEQPATLFPATAFPATASPATASPATASPATASPMGHDGASSADVLSELRALLGPLLTAAPGQQPWPPDHQAGPDWPGRARGSFDGELRRIADGEEAWW
jgi:hypothetical protein